ncbi:MAG TPA: hypothetical protein VIS51_10090 [Solirubrobacterales bacterium]
MTNRRRERVNARRRERYHTDPVYYAKKLARQRVRRAVRCGKLLRTPCEWCPSTDVVGHHDDHDKPLVVRWLCKPCHEELHYYARHYPACPTS